MFNSMFNTCTTVTGRFHLHSDFLQTDIDECLQALDNCDEATTQCINTPGSYNCSCYDQNYVWDGNICVGKNTNHALEQGSSFTFVRLSYLAFKNRIYEAIYKAARPINNKTYHNLINL